MNEELFNEASKSNILSKQLVDQLQESMTYSSISFINWTIEVLKLLKARIERGDNIKDAHPLYPNLFQHPARFPTRIFIRFPIILYSIYRYSIQKVKSDCNFIRLAQSTNLGPDFRQNLLLPPSSAFFKSNYNITLFTNSVSVSENHIPALLNV